MAVTSLLGAGNSIVVQRGAGGVLGVGHSDRPLLGQTPSRFVQMPDVAAGPCPHLADTTLQVVDQAEPTAAVEAPAGLAQG